MPTAYLTWGDADEEITVKFSVEPPDPSVGIYYAACVLEEVYDRDTMTPWPAERFEQERERLEEHLGAGDYGAPPERDWDAVADDRRERGAL